MSPIAQAGLVVGRIAAVAIAAALALVAARLLLLAAGASVGLIMPVELIAAGVGGVLAWRATAGGGDIVRGALVGAGLCGVIGFVGGFAGPMLLTPDANQGPMLGIFITGPLGAVAGAVAGGLWAARRNRR